MDPFFMQVVQEAENEEQKEMLRLERKHLRDTTNVFELPDNEFRKCYRLNKNLVQILIGELTPHMDLGERNTKMSITTRVMGALRFFAHGSYQRSIGNERNVAMAQQSLSKTLSEVCHAFEQIAPRWIKFPVSDEEKEQKKIDFLVQHNFPGTIGCIDCTHVAILEPSEGDEHLYFNRKGYHSKNVQIICDANLLILNVNASFGGATHDSFIWRNSAIKRHMEANYERGERNTWLIGDSGYPQEPWLMTPLLQAADDSPESRYNRALRNARNCVERCIGVLKMRFRCILKERILRYHPYRVGQIINAVCVLHNMCIRANIPIEEDVEEDDEEIENLQQIDGDIVEQNVVHLGRQHRVELINNYFL